LATDAADAFDALASAADPGAASALPSAVPVGGGAAGAVDDGVRRAMAARMATEALGSPFAAETRAELRLGCSAGR
jgi:hypothetical protein